ncbi:putative peptidylprolyl isomerase [Rosa chinensis]|uniref:peptidylprolyl isomerase n=2 Tax=Rosa TaxID=3764 RepID=A0A2P6S5E5_ROSCH|nr:putative peptidylprolyl isomerase [Rosa chinensis]
MVDGFPYEVPEEYQSMPLLKGRATVDMKVKVKDNPNLTDCVFRIVLDGYNAPVTSGNFVDLVERHFYDGMEIQRADGFVVQTGDPEGPAEGFIDPSTEKTRTIPLEISVVGEKAPFYGATLEELGLYKAQTKLPFNAFGTMAMARDEFENNSASSQIFWLLKESELTPSNANILDGRYAVFGYITENEDFLADVKVGDVIESIQVVSGLENLANPSYKIAG